jgi:hypothetical protein
MDGKLFEVLSQKIDHLRRRHMMARGLGAIITFDKLKHTFFQNCVSDFFLQRLRLSQQHVKDGK